MTLKQIPQYLTVAPIPPKKFSFDADTRLIWDAWIATTQYNDILAIVAADSWRHHAIRTLYVRLGIVMGRHHNGRLSLNEKRRDILVRLCQAISVYVQAEFM